LILKECFVYRIGPRPNAAGYKAQDWDPTKFIWSGRLVIMEKGDVSTIRLEDPNSGEVFAICPIDPTAVEPVLDSSRYFVLKIQDGSGRHAFVGMGFTERSDSFDFNAAVHDHLKHIQTKKDNALAAQNLQSQPKVDYSLKSGQTIHVELKGRTGAAPKKSDSGGGGGILLPPPPKSRGSIASKPAAVPQQQPPQSSQDDFFSSFTSAPSPQQQQPKGNLDWF